MNRLPFVRLFAVVAALLLLAARESRAQSASLLLGNARAQIEDINPDSAAALLVQALDRRTGAGTADQVRAWTLLGIVELMRNRQPVARQAFRRALERDANLRVDSLAHLHSDLRLVFAAEKDAYRLENTDDAPLTFTMRMSTDTVVVPHQGRYAFEVRPRRRARVVATLTPAGNENADALWTDTREASPAAVFTWDVTAGDRTIRPGRYALRITATDGSARPAATATRILVISRMPADTLMTAEVPEDSLLPEMERARKPSILLTGAALAAGAVALTHVAGNRDLNNSRADGSRFVVAGAVSTAAIIGFLTSKAERPVPENIAYNQELRERYASLHSEMTAENRRRVQAAPVRIRMEAVRMEGTR